MNWNKHCLLMLGMGGLPSNAGGAVIAQWLGCRSHNQKVLGMSPCRSGKRFFLSRVNFMCRPLFRYPFHTCVTTVTRKRSWSFCQKCRSQVTAKRTCTIWLRVWRKWDCKLEHGCMVYWDHSSSNWHQRCNDQTALRWVLKNALLKKEKKKRVQSVIKNQKWHERSESAWEQRIALYL